MWIMQTAGSHRAPQPLARAPPPPGPAPLLDRALRGIWHFAA
jgi:hypothetical protein